MLDYSPDLLSNSLDREPSRTSNSSTFALSFPHLFSQIRQSGSPYRLPYRARD
jgi:hypothetical protein